MLSKYNYTFYIIFNVSFLLKIVLLNRRVLLFFNMKLFKNGF